MSYVKKVYSFASDGAFCTLIRLIFPKEDICFRVGGLVRFRSSLVLIRFSMAPYDASDDRFRNDVLTALLRASRDFYNYSTAFRDEYAEEIRRVAQENPLSVQSPFGINTTQLTRQLPTVTAAYFPPSLLSVKKTGKHARPKNGSSSATTKAELKKLNKLLNVKPPVTHDKIVTLMGLTNVPMEKFASHRVDVLIRKYLNSKTKEFVEETFKRVFFTGAPPFSAKNTVNVTWETDVKGLMRTTMDSDGLLVKRPTERLTTIISYCQTIINGAYKDLDDPTPGLSPEAEFLRLVTRFNGYTLFVNNISQNLRYNSSSLLFTYFSRTTPGIKFKTVADTLSDVRFGSYDVEDVLLKYVVTDDVGNTDEAVKDPYNVVTMAGYAYDQVSPALRAEFVLLKFLFYLGAEFGRLIPEFILGTYKRKFEQIGVVAFHVNNVLQLCPGLMTLMFYILTLSKKPDNLQLLRDVNHKFKVITTVKGYTGRQEGIELQKAISKHVEDIAIRCMDLLITKTVKKKQIVEYASLLFLRSGLMKDAGAIVSTL